MVFVGPMDVSDIGRMAVFADPTGAAIGVWQPKSFIGAELANEAGAFTWNELNTRDLAAAKAFYSVVFGWEPHDADMGEMTYTEWKLGDRYGGGHDAHAGHGPGRGPRPLARLLRRRRHRRHGGRGDRARGDRRSSRRPTSLRAGSPSWPTRTAPPSPSSSCRP